MTASELLDSAWRLAQADLHEQAGYYHRRVGCEAVYPVYAGILQPEGVRRVSFLADKQFLRKLPFRDVTKGFRLELEVSPQHFPGHAFLHVTAMTSAFAELFVILCGDLLTVWAAQTVESEAVSAVLSRLQHWRHFFQRPGKGLTREEYIGLYTELAFLRAMLDAGFPSSRAVEGWEGPLGSNQDFLFGPIAVEVKGSTANDCETFHVSNVRQLDSTGLEHLYLVHSAFDFRENAGETLPQLVKDLLGRLEAAAAVKVALEERLISSGYSLQAGCSHDAYGFTPRHQTFFAVRDGFPRILESNMPNGVFGVSYEVTLAACRPFEVPLSTLFDAIRGGS